MFTLILSLLILGSVIPAWARPIAGSSPSSTTFQTQIIYQSPNSLFLENIAVRNSSDLLLTSVFSPTLFTLNSNVINGTLNPVHTFPNATSLTGITEYLPGVFAVAASVTNTTTRESVPGSTIVWSVDFNGQSPAVQPLAQLPGNASANGLTSISSPTSNKALVLAADSEVGAIWQINASTGDTNLVIQDASMLPNAPPPALGINGVHVDLASRSLFFTNSAQGTFSRLAFRMENGNVTPVGGVETMANILSTGQPDDFALDRQGRAWVAVHPGALVLLSPSKNAGNLTQITAVGNAQGTDPELEQPTSAAFGPGNILYVTTGVGQVVTVDTSQA
ncbi:hypothetical protein MSAN_01889400 [Mycena sanguinolenta]|uniref:SMP-30/Gluconolactonase/LRE-like region domain-containing protein n=1 Tax=Mycena sanguinolenta TaxID=230812 RepID=A0A8H7CRT5_9AGAR|nr:hypothetical protein MSAN_01889400 [Mycena sanguinolenta]